MEIINYEFNSQEVICNLPADQIMQHIELYIDDHNSNGFP
jgi:hypothetical protein